MLTFAFRFILIIVSILTMIYMIRKIRHSKLQIEYAIFWIIFSGSLIAFSIFPRIAIIMTKLMGMQAPVNFIFLFVIFVLVVKLFAQTIEHSTLENKVSQLAQKLAIQEKLEMEQRNGKCKEQQLTDK